MKIFNKLFYKNRIVNIKDREHNDSDINNDHSIIDIKMEENSGNENEILLTKNIIEVIEKYKTESIKINLPFYIGTLKGIKKIYKEYGIDMIIYHYDTATFAKQKHTDIFFKDNSSMIYSNINKQFMYRSIFEETFIEFKKQLKIELEIEKENIYSLLDD